MGKGVKGKGEAPPVPKVEGTAAGKGKGGAGWRERRERHQATPVEPLAVWTDAAAGPLDCPQWCTIRAARASEGGSNGVVFVLTAAGAYVVKASARPAEEYLGTLVLQQLGVPVPAVRVVCHVDAEWMAIKEAIKLASDKQAAVGDEESARKLRLRLRGPLNRPQLLIMSYIPDAAPFEGHAHAAAFFTKICSGGEDTAQARVEQELRALGRCIAGDVLLNNSDRCVTPCWSNEGNGGNLLLAKVSECQSTVPDCECLRFVAIDSCVTCLQASAGANLERYCQRSRDFLESLCEWRGSCISDHAGHPLGGLVGFFATNIGLTLPSTALQEVRHGVLEVLASIRDHPGGFASWVLQLRNTVATKTVKVDWSHVWEESAALLDSDFLQTMVDIFMSTAAKFSAELPPAHNIDVGATEPEGSDACVTPALVLMLQQPARKACDWADLIQRAVAEEKASHGLAPAVVMLPENAITEPLLGSTLHLLPDQCGLRAPHCVPPAQLAPLARVAEALGIFIVCGTMREPSTENSSMFYTTSIVIGPDGKSAGAYRKRRVHDYSIQAAGDRPLFIRIPTLGLSAILICLDAEDVALRAEVVRMGAQCVLNPIHIPAASAMQRQQWDMAMRTASEPLLRLCSEHDMAWLRCDQPYPCGLGSTQAILPKASHCIKSMGTGNMVVGVHGVMQPTGLTKTPAMSRERQLHYQNCGPRTWIKFVPIDGHVTRLSFLPNTSGDGARLASEQLLVCKASAAPQVIGLSQLRIIHAAKHEADGRGESSIISVQTESGEVKLKLQVSSDHHILKLVLLSDPSQVVASFTVGSKLTEVVAAEEHGWGLAAIALDAKQRPELVLLTFEHNCIQVPVTDLIVLRSQ
mmetsp:Transcript_22430/g.51378  ORF Transcript_22430/g.51378 Transcript_22430/m.51378 type:complete len:865 (-) Transcript_22430:33-2627(-)